MDAERTHYPIDLFPRGGIHWNLLGAALALRDITHMGGEAPGLAHRRFAFDWREHDLAKGTDKDLLDLLNLFWPPERYPTAIDRASRERRRFARNPAAFDGRLEFHARTHRRFGANALSADDRLLVLRAGERGAASWRALSPRPAKSAMASAFPPTPRNSRKVSWRPTPSCWRRSRSTSRRRGRWGTCWREREAASVKASEA